MLSLGLVNVSLTPSMHRFFQWKNSLDVANNSSFCHGFSHSLSRLSCSHVHLQISAVSEVEQSCLLKLGDVCGRRNAVLDKQRIANVICLHSVSNPLIL